MTILTVATALNESVYLSRITGHTSSGAPVRGEAVLVAARIQRNKGVGGANAAGSDITDADVVITVTEVQNGDMIFFPEDDSEDPSTGRVVTQVVAHRALDGTATHWTSSL